LWHSSHFSPPTKPGVYWFKDSKNNILYVGKAKNLKNRLTSYQLKNNLVGKTKLLIQNTTSVGFTLLKSELQALILEARIIKALKPKYNIRLKDDKSPLYIVITKETFPRVFPVHKNKLRNYKLEISNWYGPFPSGFKTRSVLKVLRRIFPFCNATPAQKKTLKACFYSHINPGKIIQIGAMLSSGAIVGQIAAPQRFSKCPSHLHLSAAWIGTNISDNDLCWEEFSTNENIIPVDPSTFITP